MKKVFLLALLASACTSLSDTSERSPEGDLPIRMAPAKATAAQYLATYKAICLDNFPHHTDMRIMAQKLGFRKISNLKTGNVGEPIDVDFHHSKRLGLSAAFGNSSLHWDGPRSGGTIFFHVCRFRGHVIDPQNLSAEAVRATYQSEIDFSESESDHRDLHGNFKEKGAEGRIRFQLPYIYSVSADSYFIGRDRCGALPNCQVWSEPKFEVSLPLKDDPYQIISN